AAAGRHHLDRRRRQGSARSLPRRGREPPDGADRRARQAHGQMTRPGTEAQRLGVAIGGAGPAGFYATDQLFRTPGLVVEVDMYDRVPTPYGLVRAGVAPDHQKIKAVTAAFDKVAANPAFRFFGGVELGRHLSVDDLRAHYHMVLYTTGAQTDRRMGIPGEDLQRSHAATEFVAWYNGHPDYRDLTFDLSQERPARGGGAGRADPAGARARAGPCDAEEDRDHQGVRAAHADGQAPAARHALPRLARRAA